MYFSFPRADISKIILNTLTKIACKSLTNVDETVIDFEFESSSSYNGRYSNLLLFCFKITFFIKLLHEEPRQKIHHYLLKNLDVLANQVAHLWSNENVKRFIEYTLALNEVNACFLLKASEILCILAKNSNIYFLFSFSVDDSSKSQI